MKDVLSVEEFKNKESYMGNEIKRNEILKIIKVNEYISMKEISRLSKVKWVYSEVMRLLKEKKIRRGKKGKKYYYIIYYIFSHFFYTIF